MEPFVIKAKRAFLAGKVVFVLNYTCNQRCHPVFHCEDVNNIVRMWPIARMGLCGGQWVFWHWRIKLYLKVPQSYQLSTHSIIHIAALCQSGIPFPGKALQPARTKNNLECLRRKKEMLIAVAAKWLWLCSWTLSVVTVLLLLSDETWADNVQDH